VVEVTDLADLRRTQPRKVGKRAGRFTGCRSGGRGRPLPVVPDSGSETGAASRARVRPDAVNLTVLSALTSAHNPHQVCCSNVRAVRDEEAAGSNPATPTSSEGI